MSKLSEKIEARQTGRKIVDEPFGFLTVKDETESVQTFMDVKHHYHISVMLQMTGFVKDSEELLWFKQKAKQALIHEVFGEFKPLIYEIYQHLYDRNMPAALDALRRLEAEMYS